jgi:hypothetical protein
MTGFQKVYANTDLVCTIDGTKDLVDIIINIYDTIFCFAPIIAQVIGKH